MDVRRFVTITKTELVTFLHTHLNSSEFTDLWERVGNGVDVAVARPNWRMTSELPKPTILLQKVGAETTYSNVAESQYIAEGYWKDMLFEIHTCTDDSTGGKLTVDDLASSVELVFAKYGSELEAHGILVLDMQDSAEIDDNAQYENVATITVRVLVPGAGVEPQRIELGRFQMTAPSYGHYYPGTDLTIPQRIEAVLIGSTSSSEGTATVNVRNQDNELVQLTLSIPRATAKNTQLDFTGGNPDDRYKSVTSITVNGGQAGYLFAVYNKVGA